MRLKRFTTKKRHTFFHIEHSSKVVSQSWGHQPWHWVWSHCFYSSSRGNKTASKIWFFFYIKWHINPQTSWKNWPLHVSQHQACLFTPGRVISRHWCCFWLGNSGVRITFCLLVATCWCQCVPQWRMWKDESIHDTRHVLCRLKLTLLVVES